MNKHLSFRISAWAKNHRPLAITLIIISKISIAIIGFGLGIGSWFEGLVLSWEKTTWLIAIVTALCLLVYPSSNLKKQIKGSTFYWRRKSLEGVMAALGFTFFFSLGNILPLWVASSGSISLNATTGIVIATSSLVSPIPEGRKEVHRGGKLKQWIAKKAKSKLLRVISTLERKMNQDDNAEKIVLSLLLALLAIGLGYLLLLLSCSLACSGQEGLAVFVGVVGVALLVALLIFGYRRIWRKRNTAQNIPFKPDQ